MTRAWLLALWLLLLPGPASAVVWALDSDGTCEPDYGLLDWPVIVGNGVLRPVWSLAGGLWFSAAVCAREPTCLPTAPLWIVSSTVWGSVEGVWWLVSGTLETVVPFSLDIVPPEATEAGLHPLVPFLENHPMSRRERCPAPASAGGSGP